MGKLLVMQSNVVRLDPRVYGGDGYLPGVQQDADNWARMFGKLQAESVVSHIDTTRKQFADGIRKLADQARAGDLVVIQHSGHGTQHRDTNGDEADGQDEVLCLHDGTLVDDNVWHLMLLFRSAVRVLLITDTCHSGTMYRSFVSDKMSFRTRDEKAALNCELIAVGTCSDSQTAADTSTGGAGSSALISTVDVANDYRDWILRAQKWLRLNRYSQDMAVNVVNASAFAMSAPFSVDATATDPPPVPGSQNTIRGIAIHYSNGTVEIRGTV